MTKNLLISVIIVNWNGKKYLEKCLDGILKNSYKNKEIFLVDNASTDGSVDFVKKHFPKVNVLINNKNLGFAGGHDIALEKAKGVAILLLNSDTIVPKSLISKLVVVLYSDGLIGVVQPKIITYPGCELIDSIGTFFLPTGMLYHIGREKNHKLPKYNKQLEIFSAKGVCMLIKKEVISTVGLFDPDYFAYFEETDFCMRVLLAGNKIIYTPTTYVYHIGGATAQKLASSFVQFHSYKNQLCTYLKNLSILSLFRICPVTLFFFESASVVYFIQGNFLVAFAVQRAIWWNIINLKKTIEKRQYVQKNIRKVEDSKYLPKLTKRVKISYYWMLIFGGIENYNDAGNNLF